MSASARSRCSITATRSSRIRQLADYVIARYYPELATRAEPYAELLREVTRRTAELMAQWQAVGFSHGVMNTDNMSILGLTLDYGPFGFLDAFDPGYICNHSDTGGRYAFDQQPDVAAWNITKLAQTLVPLLSVETASAAISDYPQQFGQAYLERMAAKFGLAAGRRNGSAHDGCAAVAGAEPRRLHDISCAACATSTARQARRTRHCATCSSTAPHSMPGRRAMPLRCAAMGSVDAERSTAMRAVNPKYILRNHLAEVAIRRAADHRDYSEIARLHTLLLHPFDEQPEFEAYAAEPPDWARQIEVSCSS